MQAIRIIIRSMPAHHQFRMPAFKRRVCTVPFALDQWSLSCLFWSFDVMYVCFGPPETVDQQGSNQSCHGCPAPQLHSICWNEILTPASPYDLFCMDFYTPSAPVSWAVSESTSCYKGQPIGHVFAENGSVNPTPCKATPRKRPRLPQLHSRWP